MGTIRSGVGIASGIDTAGLVNSLMTLAQQPVVRLKNRVAEFQQTDTALKSLEANLLTLATSAQGLTSDTNFSTFTHTNSDSGQLTANTRSTALPGAYQLQSVRLTAVHQALSSGFVNADQQSVGTGTLLISKEGQLSAPTALDVLNSGTGVRRGTVRVTDRSGSFADINLSNAYTVEDVLQAINKNDTISVTASTLGGKIVVTDTSGSTNANLSLVDINGGNAALDLGINQSVAAATFTGGEIFKLTGNFTLDQINDGNGLRRLKDAPDIQITLTDDTQIGVNLDNAVTLNDVIGAINNDVNNGGKVAASLANGRLKLTDTSGGGGTSAFTVTDLNNTNVVAQLGLDRAASGGTISGRKLLAGVNSVLLSNLNGGKGITQKGVISLTDRSGVSTTVDLSAAESLDEVIAAINTATTAGSVKLQLTASINSAGTGLIVSDTSGSTSANLVIADVGSSTLAADLGLSLNAAQNSVDSGSLSLRSVNFATDLSNYAPDGKGIQNGSFRITDSAGNISVVKISAAVKNIGDVLQRINLATTVSVRAELNDTGDGFVLIDDAAGSGTLKVEEVGGTTAADLRLLGNSVVGSDGKQRVSSRFAAVVNIVSTDTLNDVVTKINQSAGFVTASVFNDGSAFSSQRLKLTSTASGSAGRFSFDDGGLGLNLTTTVSGEDALLRIGGGTQNGFLIASETNAFTNAFTGIDVDLNQVGVAPAEIIVNRDDSKIEKALQSFVDGFNTFVGASAKLTKFDSTTGARGILQGQGIVLRVRSRLDSLVSRRFGSSTAIDSLFDLGIRSGADGKLKFNKKRLTAALAENRQAVTDFFQTKDTGFGAVAQAAVKSLTDPISGSFALEGNALQDSIKSLNNRIGQLNGLLAARRERLLRQFANMESILSLLSSQQSSLLAIQPLAARR